MLVFLSLCALLFHFIVSSLTRSYLYFPFLILFMILNLVLLSPLFPFSSSYLTSVFVIDSFSFSIALISYFVLFVSFIFTIPMSRFNLSSLSLFYILCFSILVFISDNFFLFYLSYEASLLPIIVIILVWGSYPDRSQASFLLLSFTAFFTIPVLYVIFYIFDSSFTLSYSITFLSPCVLPSFLSALVFVAFLVNLPVYGLHHWLPMAHVEAPTHGSIILAGILLKLGGVALVRFSPLLDLEFTFYIYLPFFCLFNTIVPVVCIIQSDFNRLVAYSSVSHILVIPLLVCVSSSVSFNSLILIMFFHGLSSPLIFIAVGLIYEISATRLLFAIRGLTLIYPLLSFIMSLSLLFSISAPPLPSFFSEVLSIMSLTHLSLYVGVSFFFFLFISLVYSLSWFSNICFSSTSLALNSGYYSLNFLSLYSITLPLLFCIPLILITDFL